MHEVTFQALTHPSTRTLRDEAAQRRLCQTLGITSMNSFRFALWWKGYAIVYLVGVVIGSFPGELTMGNLGSLGLPCLFLLPVFGYAWQRPWPPRVLWLVLFFVQVMLYLIIALAVLLGRNPGGMDGIAWLMLGVWSAPHFFAFYTYVFKSQHLWVLPNPSINTDAAR